MSFFSCIELSVRRDVVLVLDPPVLLNMMVIAVELAAWLASLLAGLAGT